MMTAMHEARSKVLLPPMLGPVSSRVRAGMAASRRGSRPGLNLLLKLLGKLPQMATQLRLAPSRQPSGPGGSRPLCQRCVLLMVQP